MKYIIKVFDEKNNLKHQIVFDDEKIANKIYNYIVESGEFDFGEIFSVDLVEE